MLIACGGPPPPSSQLTDSKAAVRAAEVAGAQQNPEAELHYKRAAEQVQLAEKLIEQGENERAVYVLRRAESDAELAIALAKQEQAQKDVQQANDEVAELKRRLQP